MDVRIYATADGGEVDCANGMVAMDSGLESATYLSLLGGNQNDSGLPRDDAKQWWGNRIMDSAKFRYRSETQYLLNTLPATSSNLKRIQDAAGRDLAWMADDLGATVEAQASIPRVGQVQIAGSIAVNDSKFPFKFSQSWNSTQ